MKEKDKCHERGDNAVNNTEMTPREYMRPGRSSLHSPAAAAQGRPGWLTAGADNGNAARQGLLLRGEIYSVVGEASRFPRCSQKKKKDTPLSGWRIFF